MSSEPVNQSEKYDDLLKQIRSEKTLPILEKIYLELKTDKDHLFDNTIISYKFSNDFIWILRNNIINIETQMNIFKLYIDEFFNMKCKPENIQKIKFFSDMLNYDSNFYQKTSNIDNIHFFANLFFDKYYPKKKDVKHNIGDYMDVLISEENNNIKLYGWIQLKIKKIDEEKKEYIFENYTYDEINNEDIVLPMDDYRVQERNTFVTEEEMIWRNNLKLDEKVDYLFPDNKQWLEANVKGILSKKEIIINAVCDDASKSRPVNIYSPFIQPYLKYSYKFEQEEIGCMHLLVNNIKFQDFNYIIPTNDNNHLIPIDDRKFFSLEFFEIMNYFTNKVLETKILEKENISIEYINMILNIFIKSEKILHQYFFGNYLYKNCFENTKKILMNFSLDKKRNKSKFYFEEIILYVDRILGYIFYSFQLSDIIPTFMIEFGYNCFKNSENFEKRLLGLNSILKILPFLTSCYFLISNKKRTKITTLINNTILDNSINNGLFNLLFNSPNVHEQLILKGESIIYHLSKLKLLKDKDIEYLFDIYLTSQPDSDKFNTLYNIFIKISEELSLSQIKLILNKIISIPQDKIREKELFILINYLSHIKTENDFKIMAKKCLDYYYIYITEYKINLRNFWDNRIGLILSYAKSEENIKYLYPIYLEKVINDLSIQNDIKKYEFYFEILSNILSSFSLLDHNKSEMNVECFFYLKKKFSEIFLQKYKNIGEIFDKIFELNEKKKDKDEESSIDIMWIIKNLNNYIDDENFFNEESLKKLTEYFIFNENSRKNIYNYLDLLGQLKKEKPDKKKYMDYFFKQLDKYLDTLKSKKEEKNKLLEKDFVNNIFNIYKDINQIIKEDNCEKYQNDLKKYIIKTNPLKYQYFDIIWKMILKLDDFKNLDIFLKDFSLKNYTPFERHEIWEKLIKKIFENINDNILLSIKMIETILQQSEIYGSAGIKSHFIDMNKKSEIKIKLSTDISYVIPEYDFSNTKFYTTDTLYDLKKMIQKKYDIDPIFIIFIITEIGVNRFFQMGLNNNCESLMEIYSKRNIKEKKELELSIRKGSIFHDSEIYPYFTKKEGGELTKKFEQLLKNIFENYSKNGILDEEMFKNLYEIMEFSDSITFTNGVAHVHSRNCKGNCKHRDNERAPSDVFRQYDIGGKRYWCYDDFLNFFLDYIKYKKEFIDKGIYNLGYTPSFDYYLSPLTKDSIYYYEENNVKEYMPRYFIANNKQYMNQLFKYANNENRDIRKAAQKLLQELCTIQEIKTIIFESNDKIGEIIFNPNLELRAYAFNIIIAEYEKDINDEKSRKLVDNFIWNNLDKIIIELIKQCNYNENIEININDKKEDNEKKEIEDEDINNEVINNIKKENENIINYFNYYLCTLKIIYYAFGNIIGNKDIIDYIDKFDKLNEENENKKLKDIIIDLTKDKQDYLKKLQLNNLIQIIEKNLIIINNKIDTIYSQGVLLSMKIIIYIILFSQYLPDKERTDIYTTFNNNEMILIKNITIKRAYFLLNKLILYLMNKEYEQKFILAKYDIMNKELFNYEKLNNCEEKLDYFFKTFIDLLKICLIETQKDKIFIVFENIMKLLFDKKIMLKEFLLSEYLKVIKEVIILLKNEKYNKLYEYDFETLIKKFIYEFILVLEKDETGKINEIKKLNNYAQYSNLEYISNIFQILRIIISLNPDKYLKLFFLNEDIMHIREKHLTKLEESTYGYNPFLNSRQLDSYMGLKNLSSICYMNSVLQQLFMINLFRYAILSTPLPTLSGTGGIVEYKEDTDNLLFQLIRMFYYLNYSEKGEYNPKNFVYSFKDYEGNPTKINIQCDAQEFLSRFIEKVEESLKNTSHKYLCNNILGGTTLQQVKCSNPDCGNISEKKENYNFLSLDIKQVSNIKACLSKFIAEEEIEDYHCEKCDKKTTNIKQVLIDKIPNILIIHLQRIAFSYETFSMEKINSYVSFEKTLNIKNYTVNKDDEDIPDEYFNYDLKGIIIHSGTARFGHYYSLISNPDEIDSNNWIKFNDSTVTNVDYNEIRHEAYGHQSRDDYGLSAYMLIYQKTIKKPIIINVKPIQENLKKILEEKKEQNIDKITLDDNNIYHIYENEKEVLEKNKFYANNENIIIKDGLLEANLISYEEALNLLKKENEENKEKKPFLNTILLDNIKIINDKKFYSSSYADFIKEEINLIISELFKDKENQKINEYIPILKEINDYIINILLLSYNKDYYQRIVDNMILIYEYAKPKELLSYIIKDIIEPNKENFYINYLCSKDNEKGKNTSIYIGKILALGINNDIETKLCNEIIKYYLDKIPVEITKNWQDMKSFNNLILTLVQNSNIIKNNFIKNGIIVKLIDYIMGKESPLYQGDEKTENKNSKGNFGDIVKSIALLFKYYGENYQKNDIILSKDDLLMINCNKFYEKVVLDDYDSEACNLLIDNKINLIKILNKNKLNDEDIDNEIIDMFMNLKIPSIKKKEEILSGLNFVIHQIQKYSEIYNSNEEKFLEKLNILLGVPIPNVISGEAEIKYISGKYQDKYTILSNIFSQKLKDKEAIDILKNIFTLLNINKTVFDYIDKLPAPNSFKYSFVDYCIKSYLLVQQDLKEESELYEDLDINNKYKDFDILVNDICTKNKKDIALINNNEKINTIKSLRFTEEYCFKKMEIPKPISLPSNVNIFLLKLYYTDNKKEKIIPQFFTNKNYFENLLNGSFIDNKNNKDKYEINAMLCLLLVSKEELNIKIKYKPYFFSDMEIKAKKNYHYFIYSTDINDLNGEEIKINNNIFDLNNLNIKVEENIITSLSENNDNIINTNNDVNDNGCVINCPACESVNIINDDNADFICKFCNSPLF